MFTNLRLKKNDLLQQNLTLPLLIINSMLKKISLFVFLLNFNLLIFSQKTDTINIIKHLTVLTKTKQYRNYRNIDQLNATAAYIHQEFLKYADSVSYQEYNINGTVYKNVICSFGTENSKRIIIGAHYDVCDDQEGADDNASGTVGLLELARQFKGQKLKNRIDLVAYTLEEPPYFRSNYMGSYIHAKHLADNKIDVIGMISIEMIGYFKDEKRSQHYPLPFMSWKYGKRGDYITLVKRFGGGAFVKSFCHDFIKSKNVKTEIFAGPKRLPGVDFSDHLNYWKYDFSALMITDTAFYRNKNYHKKSDTMDTLDIQRMAKVIDGIFQVILKMSN